ncbi:hypothetical protein BCR36DRAFT_586377 [Piromyces finnis]|uniref:Uncharacterized protein n=1 Tax=Piromyces finnis TaxID=1754191 RepID=A0A1Y1UZ53_9FUNG|nr:hypothetical protein BCR36DRAFT_586377 [Piromyces finnis]|eukprot:ORX43896.1 hypothetical protein BCR36DRAFT_586377 [Piromyces finnis]
MARGETIKITTISIIFLILLVQVKDLKGFELIFSQTLFLFEFIFKFLKFRHFKTQVELIYDEIYNIFILSPPKEENIFIARILDCTMNYECLKYFCKISLSSRIFEKYNPTLSKEWDIIYHKKIETLTN